ncbi:MAG: hypothetical protein BIP78_1351 [Candidatus Bipolaricaulis sibiricus]|uniref:Uncharacterized protein n=1 Tax=Bipolaricaulis sibiricus TaxID=2501609 RepID=A0A410FVM2_BIPS1|nr:MAG: hypothetical protein BIP78_1351 [Candidatus Bipolaricaulis sibiricus]
MRLVVALMAVLCLWGASAVGQTVLRVLIVDQTDTMEESLRILAFARALRATGLVTLKAVTQLPDAPWAEEPFLVVIVIPAQSRFIWLCTPAPVGYLPDPLPEAYRGLADGLTQAFDGQREVRGSGDDLYVFFLSLHLQRRGVLVGVDGP